MVVVVTVVVVMVLVIRAAGLLLEGNEPLQPRSAEGRAGTLGGGCGPVGGEERGVGVRPEAGEELGAPPGRAAEPAHASQSQ